MKAKTRKPCPNRLRVMTEDFFAADARWEQLDKQIRALRGKKSTEAQNRDYLYRAILKEQLELSRGGRDD